MPEVPPVRKIPVTGDWPLGSCSLHEDFTFAEEHAPQKNSQSSAFAITTETINHTARNLHLARSHVQHV